MYMETEVRKGIEWLDEYLPEWRECIDTSILDMGHVHDCILGQIFGNYDNACYENGLPIQSTEHGFYLNDADVHRYHELGETWIALMDSTSEKAAV